MASQIVLLGGTFDPVHCGHLIAARSAAEQCGINRVILMPAGAPPHKSAPVASGADRLAMLRLAIDGDELFDVSDIELARIGLTYTFDTVMSLKSAGDKPSVSILIGMDMLEMLPKWHRARELLEIADFIVVARQPWHSQLEQIREKLNRAFGQKNSGKLFDRIIQTPLIEISSTDIRNRIRQGRSIRYLVPQKIEQYIREKELYL